MANSTLIKGSDLKIILKKKKLKIQDLAERYGLVRTTISRYLNDQMAMPATFIVQVAEFANMSIEDFMVNDDKSTSIVLPPDVKTDPVHQENPAPVQEYVIPDLPELVIKGDTSFDAKAPLKWLEINSTELEKYILSLEARIKDLESRIKKPDA